MPPVSESCIFCRIAKGELPSIKIYEDDDILAFLDINPVSSGHTLVIPKGHYETLLDIPDALGAKMTPALARIGRAIMTATKADGFNCLQNNFAASGQIVFHSHWHVIPRFDGDGLKQWPHKTNVDAAALQAVAEAIRAAL
ncbi:MAG: HIT family protein [Deltaproteobacteria bacterium]|nr:HIT family protein [Deltaproteobacteria bacterium]